MKLSLTLNDEKSRERYGGKSERGEKREVRRGRERERGRGREKESLRVREERRGIIYREREGESVCVCVCVCEREREKERERERGVRDRERQVVPLITYTSEKVFILCKYSNPLPPKMIQDCS